MEKMSKMAQIIVICRFKFAEFRPRVCGFNVVIHLKYTAM